jgi:hypothetical protein
VRSCVDAFILTPWFIGQRAGKRPHAIKNQLIRIDLYCQVALRVSCAASPGNRLHWRPRARLTIPGEIHYTDERYRIAIDDVGSDSSSPGCPRLPVDHIQDFHGEYRQRTGNDAIARAAAWRACKLNTEVVLAGLETLAPPESLKV